MTPFLYRVIQTNEIGRVMFVTEGSWPNGDRETILILSLDPNEERKLKSFLLNNLERIF